MQRDVLLLTEMIDAAAVELTVPVDSLICRTVPAP
jgi:hypothetical protein